MTSKTLQWIPVMCDQVSDVVRGRRGSRTIPHTFVAPVPTNTECEPSRSYPEDARSLANTMPIGRV